ncbi:hypothetical protein AC369_09705 [Salmonella enterica subsp. diarizonae]|nr:hypothetical protein [Salmonella enterica subsp. diarizonae]EBK6837801.1 hypothetical protein [Salmonella enterica]EDR3234995.1 IS66 family insertion sequence element accessory protein TnpB [Salmonella enterica subsp. diarizonae]
MRRGIDTLNAVCAGQSEIFIAGKCFTNKVRTRIKVLRLDKRGVWLCTLRLHKSHFNWLHVNDAAWSLPPEQFKLLITGIDWQQMD